MELTMAHILKVYPRVCGGNVSFISLVFYSPGLSPRVRGKPLWSLLWRIY